MANVTLNVKHAAWTTICLSVAAVILPLALLALISRLSQRGRVDAVLGFFAVFSFGIEVIALLLAFAAVIANARALHPEPAEGRLAWLALVIAVAVALCYAFFIVIGVSMGHMH